MSRARDRLSVFVFAAVLLALYVGLAFAAGWLTREDAAVIASELFGGVHDFFHSVDVVRRSAPRAAARPRLLGRDDLLGLQGRAAADRATRCSSCSRPLIGRSRRSSGRSSTCSSGRRSTSRTSASASSRSGRSRAASAAASCTARSAAARSTPDFLVCPVCTTKLRQACATCRRPLERAWQVCPYCETPVDRRGRAGARSREAPSARRAPRTRSPVSSAAAWPSSGP